MGFIDKTKKFLGIESPKNIEQLEETIETQKLLLQENEDNSKTKASYIARESKKVEDAQGLIRKRVPVKELQLLYLNNQFIFRGVNVRADEVTSRGYEIYDGDEEGIAACEGLMNRSGGLNLIWQYSVNADVAGDGYLEAVLNEKKNKMVYLRHVNPINFGWWTDPDNDDLIVLDDDRTPKQYMQKNFDKNGAEERIPVPKDRIYHLKFNTFGDEFNGVSSIQPVYNTAIRLMNMEQAAAEAAVKTANPTWVVRTKSKSPSDLARWAATLGRISAKEVVFLPDGVETKMESPGAQNFSQYSDYFLNAVVAALGVPKTILTGSQGSEGGNRSTTQVLSKHFYSVIRGNQRYIEEIFNKIFADYAIIAGFKAPKLRFTDIAEDADRNGQRAQELYLAGIITLAEARGAIGLETDDETKKELMDKEPKSSTSGIDENAEMKKADMEAWHGAEPGSPAGSQKNEKKVKKTDPGVPSVD